MPMRVGYVVHFVGSNREIRNISDPLSQKYHSSTGNVLRAISPVVAENADMAIQAGLTFCNNFVKLVKSA
jgi:hypothetical protein